MITDTHKTEPGKNPQRLPFVIPSPDWNGAAPGSEITSAMDSTIRRRFADDKVLVVNDDRDAADLMSFQLRQAGFAVLTAFDGREGFEVACSEYPDLIISDIAMPVVDGIEMCRQIRGEELRNIPILLVSGVHKDNRSVLEAYKAGADDFLAAPYEALNLITKAARLIERKQTEAALQASESELRTLFAAMTDVVLVLDSEGRYLKVAPTNPAYLYKPPTELIGRELHDVFPKEQADFFFVHIWRALRENKRHNVEYLLRIDETDVWFNACVSRLTRDSVLWVARDITEYKRAEEELRKSEERYRRLVENAHDMIYTHDLNGNFTSINAVAEQITGYTREEALRMNIADTIAAEQLDGARQNIAEAIAGQETGPHEFEIIARDGSRIAVEVNTSVILKDGVAVAIQGVARDVTERKKLEQQLRQAQKMEAVGLLAGGIAHDFNNLLTAINGYSDLVLAQLKVEDPLWRNVEQIKKAGDRAASLTRQLLAFSRKQILQPRVLNLNSIVADMGKMIGRLIGEEIELRTVLNPELGSVRADPSQIEQVLLNLAVNARDAMPDGGKLTIETANISLGEGSFAQRFIVPPGDYVRLVVSDTGAGMDAATKARIFEPFFTTKESGRGTGLGLSTVYGIVKQSEGYILVYTEPAHGTAFKIYLPRVDERVEEYIQGVAIQEHYFQGTETILVAEDDDTVRQLTRELLEIYGYNVLEASNGGSALLLCERYEEPIHLLLTDVIMPEMSGHELTTRLAQLHPEMKVLYMSGHTEDVIVNRGVLIEGTAFIQKPFAPDALARRVREVLDGPSIH